MYLTKDNKLDKYIPRLFSITSLFKKDYYIIRESGHIQKVEIGV